FCLGEMPEALPALQEIQNSGFSGFAEVVFLDPGANGAAPPFADASPTFVEIYLRDRYSPNGGGRPKLSGYPGESDYRTSICCRIIRDQALVPATGCAQF
ncbi:hypothetical protein, partial [Pseudomonas aeruginosa]|uniref:hypothetical protein n=1 Tax=Pseudomonas aeruginosa TaxID=287 RepID=UPI0039688BBA